MEGMKPVKIYSCADRVDADMITETLNDRGIPAYSESKGSGDYMNIYMGASMFGNDIYVNEKDADRAKEIVKALTLLLREKRMRQMWIFLPGRQIKGSVLCGSSH